jgi:hypothetical protein
MHLLYTFREAISIREERRHPERPAGTPGRDPFGNFDRDDKRE